MALILFFLILLFVCLGVFGSMFVFSEPPYFPDLEAPPSVCVIEWFMIYSGVVVHIAR